MSACNSQQMSGAAGFDASIFMNRAFEKAAKASATDFSIACIHEIAKHYGFDGSEAVARLGLDTCEVKKSATRKKGEGKVQGKKPKAEPKAKRDVPKVTLPWTGVCKEEWCSGLRLNHGLHSQCTMEKGKDGEFCKTCQKQADKNGLQKASVPIADMTDPSSNTAVEPQG